jgi:flagellar basal-body rod protein FlgC
MVSAIESAISGLNAASTRLNVSANNIANQFSTKTNVNGTVIDQPYTPQQVDQVTLSGGGVQAKISNVNPATITVADPTSATGLQQLPNVDPAQELVGQIMIAQSYKANLKTIEEANKMLDSLLNIQT